MKRSMILYQAVLVGLVGCSAQTSTESSSVTTPATQAVTPGATLVSLKVPNMH